MRPNLPLWRGQGGGPFVPFASMNRAACVCRKVLMINQAAANKTDSVKSKMPISIKDIKQQLALNAEGQRILRYRAIVSRGPTTNPSFNALHQSHNNP